MERGKIILLNGVSSAGKTSLARALVDQLPGYFYLGIDDFDMLIERMEDRSTARLIHVETEYFFHKTIAMFSETGVNMVVDHILHDAFTRVHIFQVLSGFPVLFVGVHCPEHILDERERARGDRRIGQAREQLEFVHKVEMYDVEVDTHLESTETCARRVLEFLNTGRSFMGWQQTETAIRNEQEQPK